MNSMIRRGISQAIQLQRNKAVVFSSSSLSQGERTLIFSKNDVKATMMLTRGFSSLPYHLVVGMPALSPTMEAGNISAWKVGEGEAFAAGDSLAEIETDKATIDFEAQDDGYVAKILVEAGSGEISVGVPIMVTVEDEDDIVAFKDFVPPEGDVTAEEPVAPAEPAEPTPPPVVEEVAPPPPAPVAPEVTPEPVVATAPVTSEPAPEVAAADEVSATMVSPGWGKFAKVKSPLASTLSASQKKYIELYGSTGQVPL